MNAQIDLNSEHKILDAAKTIFIQKGFDGARMQDIADEAKLNKSLVHYYYRSKEELFAKWASCPTLSCEFLLAHCSYIKYATPPIIALNGMMP